MSGPDMCQLTNQRNTCGGSKRNHVVILQNLNVHIYEYNTYKVGKIQ
jgi:hypothetical protein